MAQVRNAVGDAVDIVLSDEETGWSQTRVKEGKDGSWRKRCGEACVRGGRRSKKVWPLTIIIVNALKCQVP